MRLRQKMFLGSAFLSVIPVLITAYFTSNTAAIDGAQALTELAQSHISSIRDNKKAQVESYFNNMFNQIQVYAGAKTTIDAMRAFKDAFPKFQYEAVQQVDEDSLDDEGPPIPKALPIAEYRDALEEYYSNDFSEEYGSLNNEEAEGMSEILDKLEDNTVALQYFYIVDNPNPLGTKDELFAARDDSSYTKAHRIYHNNISEFTRRFAYDDVFFVDDNTGHIIYSATKSIDFGTSLREGPYAKTSIAHVFEEVNRSLRRTVHILDFTQYFPSYQNQAAFVGTQVYQGTEKLGILIFQISVDRVNDIMTYDRVWRLDESGRTGEAYIVASDGTMRNDSRMLVENKEEYLAAVEQVGLSSETIASIELKDTSVGLQVVDNPGTRAAAAGVTGFDLYENYRGDFVLSAYAPINVPGLTWAVFSEIQELESLEELEQLTTAIRDSSIPIALIVLVLGGAAGFLFFGRVAAPIGHMETIVTRVAEGDFTARSDIDSDDELGTLSNAFNGLLDDRLSALAKSEKENEMLNNSIIELLKASFQLSQRDLTVQVPVTEDVTGPLADALKNLDESTLFVNFNYARFRTEFV